MKHESLQTVLDRVAPGKPRSAAYAPVNYVHEERREIPRSIFEGNVRRRLVGHAAPVMLTDRVLDEGYYDAIYDLRPATEAFDRFIEHIRRPDRRERIEEIQYTSRYDDIIERGYTAAEGYVTGKQYKHAVKYAATNIYQNGEGAITMDESIGLGILLVNDGRLERLRTARNRFEECRQIVLTIAVNKVYIEGLANRQNSVADYKETIHTLRETGRKQDLRAA
jgi:hypothetical protein